MGNLSKYFNREEFECECGCGFSTVDHELIMVLEWLRTKTGAAITITSGNRCPPHNANVGGARRSKHMYSIAADIKVEGYTPALVGRLLDEKFPDRYGIKVYSGWVHIDVRADKWRG